MRRVARRGKPQEGGVDLRHRALQLVDTAIAHGIQGEAAAKALRHAKMISAGTARQAYLPGRKAGAAAATLAQHASAFARVDARNLQREAVSASQKRICLLGKGTPAVA